VPISAKTDSSAKLKRYKTDTLAAPNIKNFSKKNGFTSKFEKEILFKFADSDVNLLKNFIYSMPEAIVVTDHKKIIKFCNPEAQFLFGYSERETIGKEISCLLIRDLQLFELADRSDSWTEASHWRKLTEKPLPIGLKKDGEHIPIEILCSDQTYGQMPLSIFLIRDASTAFRQQLHIAELEREIAHLSQHSLMGELAAAITHELSQPLTAITNYTAAAVRAASQNALDSTDGRLELISKVGEQAKRALLTVHRLRQLIQYRGAECADDDLRLALEDAIQLATIGANQHAISIKLDIVSEPVIVRMDRIQIQILLANLIRNAIDELRGQKDERKLWISLRLDKQNLAVVTVEDNGPGIAQHVFEKIFDPFLTTKQEGLGVGLALSRRIAKAHGGRLLARNRQEGGAAFSFVIPLSMSEKVRNE
jgi:two-component system sensor kinase FixL